MPIKSESFFQFVRFGMIGVVNTLIDFSVYVLLTRNTEFFGEYIYLAHTMGFAAAATFSLFANKRWTFKQTNKVTRHEAMKFYTTAISAFILGTAVFYMFVELIGAYDIVAKIIATGVTVVCNFFLSKFWVFRTASEEPIT